MGLTFAYSENDPINKHDAVGLEVFDEFGLRLWYHYWGGSGLDLIDDGGPWSEYAARNTNLRIMFGKWMLEDARYRCNTGHDGASLSRFQACGWMGVV